MASGNRLRRTLTTRRSLLFPPRRYEQMHDGPSEAGGSVDGEPCSEGGEGDSGCLLPLPCLESPFLPQPSFSSSPLQELDLLDSSNAVYKLIGPVLVKQDTEEAKATVGKRLDYITGEM